MEPRKNKSVCIFDFDGTLVDSMNWLADLAGSLIEEHYQVPFATARRDYLKTSGLPFSRQLGAMFPQDPRNSEVAKIFETRKQIQYFDRPFFEEVPEAISELKSKGVKVVVSSNNDHDLVEAFLKRQTSLHFDLVLGFRPGFSKGQAHFSKALQHFERTVDEAVFVGDSLYDAEKARDFGVDFIGRLGTFQHEQFSQAYPKAQTVQNLQELIGVLCK